MNFSDILKSLNQASAFELYRLHQAIGIILEEPRWIEGVRSQLTIGQQVEYLNPRQNKLIRAIVTKLDRKNVHLDHIDDDGRWIMPYTSINLNGLDVQIRNQTKKGLTRNELAIGERVCFKDHDNNEISGIIIRLNPKTASIQTDKHKWKVAYEWLYRVMDAESSVYDPKLLGD